MGIKRVPTYFNEFACIGGACEDNCCIGWEVDIDDESLEVYKSVGGEFGDKLRRCMNDENSFTLKNNRCPFLNDKNLCDIFINIGEDKLCTVCTEYPRFTETYGSLTEKGLGMSCESAAEFIFKSDKPTGFETEKFDYEEECDEDFLRILLNVRENIFDVLKNRKMNISDRVKTILNYAYDVQDKINNNNVDKVPQSVDNCDFSQSEKCINDIKECVKLCLSLEIMEDSWTGVIENTLGIFDNYDNLSGEFDLYISGREYEYENLLVYFIYRYLLKAVFDCDVLTKVRFAAVSYVIIRQLDIARWLRNGKEFSLKGEYGLDPIIDSTVNIESYSKGAYRYYKIDSEKETYTIGEKVGDDRSGTGSRTYQGSRVTSLCGDGYMLTPPKGDTFFYEELRPTKVQGTLYLIHNTSTTTD